MQNAIYKSIAKFSSLIPWKIIWANQSKMLYANLKQLLWANHIKKYKKNSFIYHLWNLYRQMKGSLN